jgi:hypothetical protein
MRDGIIRCGDKAAAATTTARASTTHDSSGGCERIGEFSENCFHELAQKRDQMRRKASSSKHAYDGACIRRTRAPLANSNKQQKITTDGPLGERMDQTVGRRRWCRFTRNAQTRAQPCSQMRVIAPVVDDGGGDGRRWMDATSGGAAAEARCDGVRRAQRMTHGTGSRRQRRGMGSQRMATGLMGWDGSGCWVTGIIWRVRRAVFSNVGRQVRNSSQRDRGHGSLLFGGLCVARLGGRRQSWASCGRESERESWELGRARLTRVADWTHGDCRWREMRRRQFGSHFEVSDLRYNYGGWSLGAAGNGHVRDGKREHSTMGGQGCVAWLDCTGRGGDEPIAHGRPAIGRAAAIPAAEHFGLLPLRLYSTCITS